MATPQPLDQRDPDFCARARKIRLAVFDFDGVFTDNHVYVMADGAEAVRCWRGDGLGLRRLEAAGIEPIILSTEPNEVVELRARKLQIACVHGVADKAASLREQLTGRTLEPADCLYVGNDINDLDCLKLAGLPIAVSDAHPEILSAAKFITERPGGKGAVREVCDILAAIKRAE